LPSHVLNFKNFIVKSVLLGNIGQALSESNGYARREFDEFIEKTMLKTGKGINQGSTKKFFQKFLQRV
jgi:hypothetical protein